MVPKNPTLPVFSDPHAIATDLQKGSTMTRKGAYAAISYMVSAVLLVMFNKAALSSYQFPCANVITLFQMVCSCSLLYSMRRWNIISFKVGTEPQNMENDPTVLVPMRSLVHTLPLAISYLLYMLVSMASIRGVSVPMYTTIRRTTVAFTMVMEYFLAGQTHSPYVVGSVGIIIFGAVVAGAGDLSFDSYGYAVVFASNICTAIYLAFIARIGKSSGLSSFGLMWCNGIICTPILLLWTSVSGDLKATSNFSHLLSSGFQVVMLLSCILAFFLNYFVFMNTTLNSALTQTICGNLKDLFTIGLGWLLFGGLPFDLLNIVGQSLGFLGSCLYAYCKIKGRRHFYLKSKQQNRKKLKDNETLLKHPRSDHDALKIEPCPLKVKIEPCTSSSKVNLFLEMDTRALFLGLLGGLEIWLWGGTIYTMAKSCYY